MPAIRRHVGPIAAYAVVSAIMASPLVNYSALASAIYPGDARLIVWTLAWDNHAVLAGLPLFDSNIFYPASSSLAYNEHLFGLSLFTLPFYAATANPVLSYNVVWLLSFLLNAIAMHVLLKRYTGSELGAFAGALIYTFSFYKMLHAHGHLHLVWTWLLPLSLLLLERWTDRPSLARAGLWGSAVLLQSLTSWYLLVLTVLAQGVLVLFLVPHWQKSGRFRQAWQLLVVSGLAGAALLPFAMRYRELAASSISETSRYSADLSAYLIPPENTWMGQLWLSHVGPGPRWIWEEGTVFVGWTALLLGLFGLGELVRCRRWRLCATYLALTLFAFGLSLGPAADGESWRPFSAFAALPGLSSFRAPARFALLVILGVAVLAAFGGGLLARSGRAPRLLLLVAIPVMLSEWYVVGFPGGKPEPFFIPEIYRVEALRNARALVSLPEYRARPDWYVGADYLYFSTAHWRPIVNGFGRSEPDGHARIVSYMRAFPGPNNARMMRQLGIEYVVVHADSLPGGAQGLEDGVMATGEYELVARIGSDYLFRVRPEPPR